MLDLSVLLPFIDRTVADSTACEGAATYLVRGDRLVRAHAEIRDEHGRFRTPVDAPARLAGVLGTTREPLVTEELDRDATTEVERALHRDLARLGWALLLPLVSEDALIGILAVGAKRSGDPFYPDDLDLLMTLANQAGVAVHNAQLYAQVVLANEYIENIVATIESGVVAIDAESRVTMFNRAAEELTGIKGPDATDVAGLPECLGSALRRALEEGERRTEPEVAMPARDTTRPVLCTTAPLRDPSGTVLGAVAVFSDLTALKELETQRRRAERLAYFEALASGIAHEIKNPLVAIKTFVQLVPRRHLDRNFVENFSLVVAREIGAMERLVDRLRTLSRPGERPHRTIDVRTPVAEALELLAARLEDKGIAVAAELGAEPAPVLGEEGELKELFLNLLVNASDATPAQGTIAVRVARADARASVAIADSGPGVPTELIERIFDPFFTTKEHGSGLGLSICAGIADAHGARVTAANRPDGGAVFTVDFPLAAAVAAEVKR
jgi:PAS domain S-box-containing protein